MDKKSLIKDIEVRIAVYRDEIADCVNLARKEYEDRNVYTDLIEYFSGKISAYETMLEMIEDLQ